LEDWANGRGFSLELLFVEVLDELLGKLSEGLIVLVFQLLMEVGLEGQELILELVLDKDSKVFCLIIECLFELCHINSVLLLEPYRDDVLHFFSEVRVFNFFEFLTVLSSSVEILGK
jgi:hypothetical protein